MSAIVYTFPVAKKAPRRNSAPGFSAMRHESLAKMTEAKHQTVPVESEQCRQCRIKLRELTELIYLAAKVADEIG
ncbi:hypothetical protein [Burkholderia sp. Ac-20353]|uniref:hypothetical protein n=1 Tax=Burkholderia sp. Ac-20353 TaxID=2703894 RepID=UPI00197BED3E|nr:hypothetical protein [Burkholderia sp. Ac-20353]MBN3788318.1 hypothetical protein [Burkholderia sp. Ac-20353]